MGKEREAATLAPDVAEAEAAVADARSTLDEARHATTEAEEAFRARQLDEAGALQSYEEAVQRVRDAFAAERARIEEQMRTAEHELKALDARLSELEVDSTSPPMLTNPISFESSGNGKGGKIGELPDVVADRDDVVPDRDDVVPDRDPTSEGPADGSAYEDDWYKTLKHRSENGSPNSGE